MKSQRHLWLIGILTCATLLSATAFVNAQKSDASPASMRHQLQLNPGGFKPGNTDEPLLDLSKSMRHHWQIVMRDGSRISAPEIRAMDNLNDATGLPRSLPDDAAYIGGMNFLGTMGTYPDHFADKYTLEWEGDGYGFVGGQPRDLQTRIGRNKVRFFVSPQKRAGRELRFSRIRGDGITKFRIYRDEYKDLLDAGEIWNPDFIDQIKPYDIIRTMDMQAINSSPIRSFADVARPDDAVYGLQLDNGWPPKRRYGAPYEIFFDLAEKADIKLWLHVPPMIGAPVHAGDLSLRKDDNPDHFDAKKFQRMGTDHGVDIIDSPEWEIFAREFTDRLVASTYPASKPLYIELGNEIWNEAPGFELSTLYVAGIGKAINKNWGAREGYGILSARWAAALEAEFKARDLSYNVIYVMGSQTAWGDTTPRAIRGFKHQLSKSGADYDDIRAKTGFALTTYYGCFNKFSDTTFGKLEKEPLIKSWEDAIKNDPEKLKKAYHDFCVDGPDTVKATRPWLLNSWRHHQRLAEKEGFKILGAYEGGSHDMTYPWLRSSPVFQSWWREYHWGSYGVDVTRQMNRSIIETFPGAILANYDLTGPPGDWPWHDGHRTGNTAMLDMWAEFGREAGLE